MESLRIIESVLGYSGDFFSALSSAEGGKSSRGQPYCLSLRRNLQITEYQVFNQNQSWIFGNSENA